MTSIPHGASRLTKSNANSFICARAYGLFQPRGTIPRGLCPLGWSLHTRLIPPHSVGISPYVTRLPQVLLQCGCGRGWRRVHRPPLKDCTARLILQFSENRSITFTRSDELARIESLAVGPSTTRRHDRQFDIMSMIFFALVPEGRLGIPSLSEYCITFPYRQIIPRGVSYRSGHPVG